MKYVAYDGSYYCYLSDDGIHTKRLECSHKTPREAKLHTVPVYVSPLRLPDEPPVFPPEIGQPVAGVSSRRRTASPRVARQPILPPAVGSEALA